MTAEIRSVSHDLPWPIEKNNPLSVRRRNGDLVFQFEWTGPLFIDPDMGLLFSVCNKIHYEKEYRCIDPEYIAQDPYSVSLAYAARSILAIDVVIIGMDVEGEVVVSTGVHRFHCMFYLHLHALICSRNCRCLDSNTLPYPRFIRPVGYSSYKMPAAYLIFHASVLMLFVFCCYMTMLSCCFGYKRRQHAKYQMVKATEAVKEKAILQETQEEDGEGEMTIVTEGVFVETM